MPEAQIMKASSPSLTKPTFGYPSFRIPFLNDADMEIFTVFVLIMVLLLGFMWASEHIMYSLCFYDKLVPFLRIIDD